MLARRSSGKIPSQSPNTKNGGPKHGFARAAEPALARPPDPSLDKRDRLPDGFVYSKFRRVQQGRIVCLGERRIDTRNISRITGDNVGKNLLDVDCAKLGTSAFRAHMRRSGNE